MPERCYYVPASYPLKDPEEHREASDRITMFTGEWDFRYYASIYDLQDEFYRPEYQEKEYRSVPVPGVWQQYGCDRHQYTNIRYPFPADPPYVPQDNPCGAYRTSFIYFKKTYAPRVFLDFEGVDSCFYVWLNGKYVGYSQVSHALSEFDITPFVRSGENLLAVLVLKWCDGSYLEDQDKFRMTGIFRDVYLLERPENGIWDYFVHAVPEEGKGKVNIEASYIDLPVPIRAVMEDANGKEICSKIFKDETEFIVDAPHLWSSEDPYLYTLILETANEVITERVGFREIHVENSVVYVNGKPIKFRGVNRHDSDPVTGPVISVEHMKKDLCMMKRNNFNAIRTSHYPNAPMFYQLCDRYGFYVIDEADNESHGPWMLCYSKDFDEERASRWNELISDNPDFNEATLDRTRKLVERDKNRPCVVIWSMGNESGFGCTFENALAWTKQRDPSRLTHYESAYYRGKKRKYDYSKLDLYSRMYPAFEQVIEYAESDPDKPFLMCEYCHSMGNGAGDYEDYFELIEKYDCICGGFVWEWCDHAIAKGEEKGKTIYYYGGDHGEYPHDGNFCMDGLVYPDRREHMGLREYKNVHRPVRALQYDEVRGKLRIKNELNFQNVKDAVTFVYELMQDGNFIAAGRVEEENVPSISPHETGELPVPLEIPQKGRVYLKICYLLKQSDAFRPAGFMLGFDEIKIGNAEPQNQTVLALEESATSKRESENGLQVNETERELTVQGKNFTYVFNKLTGMPQQLEVNGSTFLTRPMEINLWRAPTDNDMYIKQEWYRAMYDKAFSRSYDMDYTISDEGLEIRCRMGIVAVAVQRVMDINAIWKIAPAGRICMELRVSRNMEFPELPRFGIRLFLPTEMERVCYYGLGPEESYPDKRRASSHSRYESFVSLLHEDYIKPQENGSHDDCDYVILSGPGKKLTAYGLSKTFSFNASEYTQEELTEKRHNYELEKCGSTVLCLDYRQNGIGSNSCGPRPQEKYRLNEEKFQYELCLLAECSNS